MLVYTIGRTYLIELYHRELQSDQVRIVDGPMSMRAHEQLMALETELRDTGMVLQMRPGSARRPRYFLRHAGMGGPAPASHPLGGHRLGLASAAPAATTV
jgi:hypothetical protein